MIKVGLIGKGYYGSFIHKKLTSEPISNICEVSWVANSKKDYKSLLTKNKVDWVFICTPSQMHYEHAKFCLSQKVNVFLEKPGTLFPRHTKELIDLADFHGVKLYIDDVFNHREDRNDITKALKDNPKNILCRWKKVGRSDYAKFTRASFPNLVYHDLYLLYDYLKDHQVGEVETYEKDERLLFTANFIKGKESVKVCFDYDRNWQPLMSEKQNKDTAWNARLHSVCGVDLSSRPPEDPLKIMIHRVLLEEVNFDKNQKLSLWTDALLNIFQKKIYQTVRVIGGGIFGCTAAYILSKNNYYVELFEKNDSIMSSTTLCNQQRLHKGYHYPRSEETAKQSRDSEPSFIKEFGDAIMDTETYYSIGDKDSMVDSKQFEKFMKKLKLPFEKVDTLPNCEATYKVEESIWNPTEFKKIVENNLGKYMVDTYLGSEVTEDDIDKIYDDCPTLICTYSLLNKLLREEDKLDYQFEVVEKPFVKLPKTFKGKNHIIMDGPFGCLNEFGDTGLHILGNVVYTVLSENVGKKPMIPEELSSYIDKGIIKNPKITNISKFIEEGSKWWKGFEKSKYVGSMFGVRVVLPNRHHDDARPTTIRKINNNLYTIFSGKIGTCVSIAEEFVNVLKR